MAGNNSAGVALCRPPSGDWSAAGTEEAAEVLVVHPGGPLWRGKDVHAWSIPKGEFDPEVEDSGCAARREFAEELGCPVPEGPTQLLETFKAGRKVIWPWLVLAPNSPDTSSPDTGLLRQPSGHAFGVDSNLFEMEWPPKSKKMVRFPEVDVAQWVAIGDLASKLHKGQLPLVARLQVGLQQWLVDPDSFSTW